jgi:hypothetical protein
MRTIKGILVSGCILTLLASGAAQGALTQWSGGGPFATGDGNRIISALAVAPNGKTLFIGNLSGSVFSYDYGYLLTVTVPPTGSDVGTGQVASDTGGINCSSGGAGTCSANYLHGTPVTLTATTAIDSTFNGWLEDCSGVAPCILAMTVDKNVTAGFGLGPNIQGPKAKIAATGYNSVNDAYNAAGANAIIMAVSGTHTIGALTLDLGKDATIKGSYNPFFTHTTDLPTLLQGTLVIQSGSLKVNKVKVKP